MRVMQASELKGPGPYKVLAMFDESGEEVNYVNACEYGIVRLPDGEQVKVYKDNLREAILHAARKQHEN